MAGVAGNEVREKAHQSFDQEEEQGLLVYCRKLLHRGDNVSPPNATEQEGIESRCDLLLT